MRWHCGGWLGFILLVFCQPFGRVAADTKLDLAVDPLGFLAGALTPYSDNFPLGQLQNQAYGYLFPQGAFFAATDVLPDWVAQRLWWAVVLGVGYSGMLVLCRRVGLHGWWAVIAAVAYALSPHTLTTLTAISSETWPAMLAPWVLAPFLRDKLGAREVAAAVIPVACLGAVNATATLAALLPAVVVLTYRRKARVLAGFTLGSVMVSLWWLGPLVILGRYSPPFTDFIESAFVTTRWLNPTEILRGATSWAPFVDTERQAGFLLATSPAFVLITALVAAAGLAGLGRTPRVFRLMALVGVIIMGCHLGFYLHFLDGDGAIIRNLHKFDLLLRLPLALGTGYAARELRGSPRKLSALALVVGLLVAQSAPALSGRLLPQGSYQAIPAYWVQATDYINAHAAGTRTLIYPPRSFARADWGWTRDEPAQALLDTPWAVRDAIPLVPPEAIRGLDGVMAAVAQGRFESLQRLGIGAVILRDDSVAVPGAKSFGPLRVKVFNPELDVLLTADDPLRVAGGGESLAFVDGPARLVPAGAQVVTDTPLLIDRNYGTLAGSSAPLIPGTPPLVHNRQRDYPSAGTPVAVREYGGHAAASSSWADANALTVNPAASITAAVDGSENTFWWPAPGDPGWLELRGDYPARATLDLLASDSTEVTVSSNDASVRVRLYAHTPATVTVPGGRTRAIRITLHSRAGLNANVRGHEIRRIVSVPDTSPDVQEFFFQRLLVDTKVLIREFGVPREMDFTIKAPRWVTIDGTDYYPGQRVTLRAGRHTLSTHGRFVRLDGGLAHGRYQASTRDIAPANTDRLLVTGRAFNPGLRGRVGDHELAPTTVDAATQAFRLPAGVSGRFEMYFVATPAYRAFLFGGGALALITLAICLFVVRRRPEAGDWEDPNSGGNWPLLGLCALGLPGIIGGAVGYAAARWTTLPRPALSFGLMLAAGAMLARGPWASAAYAGDFWLTGAFATAALAIAVWAVPPSKNSPPPAAGSPARSGTTPPENGR